MYVQIVSYMRQYQSRRDNSEEGEAEAEQKATESLRVY